MKRKKYRNILLNMWLSVCVCASTCIWIIVCPFAWQCMWISFRHLFFSSCLPSLKTNFLCLYTCVCMYACACMCLLLCEYGCKNVCFCVCGLWACAHTCALSVMPLSVSPCVFLFVCQYAINSLFLYASWYLPVLVCACAHLCACDFHPLDDCAHACLCCYRCD